MSACVEGLQRDNAVWNWSVLWEQRVAHVVAHSVQRVLPRQLDSMCTPNATEHAA